MMLQVSHDDNVHDCDNDDVDDDNNAETKLELQCLFSLSIGVVSGIFTSYPCKVELVILFPGVLACIQVTLEESGNPLATVSAFGINDEECQVKRRCEREGCRNT